MVGGVYYVELVVYMVGGVYLVLCIMVGGVSIKWPVADTLLPGIRSLGPVGGQLYLIVRPPDQAT